jgi:cell division transport system permease protein
MSNLASRRTRPNYLYAMISVALVLFLLGFFGIILLHMQQFVRLYKERVNLIVELNEIATPTDLSRLEVYLQAADYVRPGTVNKVSKEKAAELMRDEFGEAFLKLDLPNPFLDVVYFNLKAAYLEPQKLQQIREELKSVPAVNDVYYEESLVDNIASNLQKAGYFALGFGLFFIVVSATLIHNTIRLALYSNRFLIKNMELVGASWGFISKPYLFRAILHGLLSSLLAILALVGLLYWINHSFPEIYLFQDIRLLLLVFISIVSLGVLIYALSTYYVVNKYLKMRVDDLY